MTPSFRALHDGPASEQRRHPRHRVELEAVLLANEARQPTRINDISAGGAGLNGIIGVSVNQAVVLELPDGRQIAGTIVWRLAGCVGVQFAQMLDAGDPLLRTAADGSA